MANPDTADIRPYLTSAYSDEEITVLCTDYFRDVSDNFATGMTKGQKIQLLLDHCQRRELIPNLFAALQKDRPEQYRRQFGQVAVEAAREAEAKHQRPAPKPWPRWTRVTAGLMALMALAGVIWAITRQPESPAIAQATATLTAAPTPTPAIATLPAIMLALTSTPTAKSPTQPPQPTDTPTATPSRTRPPRPTDTATPTETPRPTDTAEPSATPPPPSFTVANASVNVRAGPGTVYPVIGALQAGQSFAITGRDEAGDWWQFEYQGKAGWVSNGVVSASSTGAVAVVAAPPTPAATATRALGIGSTWTSPIDGMVQVYVPAGEFLMGSADSDPAARPDEKPQHKVTLDAFWIDRTEVTQDQYDQCVTAGNCGRADCHWVGSGGGDAPVVCVVARCGELLRMGGTAAAERSRVGEGGARHGRIYPWGNQVAAGDQLSRRAAEPVGSHPNGAGPYGALDMSGSVWEWVADWYDGKYYVSSPAQNPKGPDAGQTHVVRGGWWDDSPEFVRAAVRHDEAPNARTVRWGFRCARSN